MPQTTFVFDVATEVITRQSMIVQKCSSRPILFYSLPYFAIPRIPLLIHHQMYTRELQSMNVCHLGLLMKSFLLITKQQGIINIIMVTNCIFSYGTAVMKYLFLAFTLVHLMSVIETIACLVEHFTSDLQMSIWIQLPPPIISVILR